jgi:hypothetical protein
MVILPSCFVNLPTPRSLPGVIALWFKTGIYTSVAGEAIE